MSDDERSKARASNQRNANPLCVDLDGTLVRSDLLVESVFLLLKKNFLNAFLLPIWLMHGKAHLKQKIAERIEIDPALLPYHTEFLAYLEQQHASGRRLVLATASNEKFAAAIASKLGIFDAVLASDAETNLSGNLKLRRLERELGQAGFDYAGNAMIDLPLWARAGEVILVNPASGVSDAIAHQGRSAKTFEDRAGRPLRRYVKALRPHQWLKNLLVFVPLVMSHRIGDPALLANATLAFLAFSACASSAYLLNDLVDLPDDRQHQTKRNRPFAAGDISIMIGVMLIPGLLIFAAAIALLLPLKFGAVLALYYGLTVAYSLRLKRAALVDVLTLAGLYTIRIIAGAAAVAVTLSFWLLAFSMFLFVSLALVKRYTELLALDQHTQRGAAGRAYRPVDLETLSQFGSASAFMAVLVLALYINSKAVVELYSYPQLIWLLCPLLLYMVMHIWFLARRDEMHEDPVVFVIRDRTTQLMAAVGGVLLWLAV